MRNIIFMVCALPFMTSCSQPKSNKIDNSITANVSTDTLSHVNTLPAQEEKSHTNWIYSTEEDPMTSAKTYFARNTSTNSVNFDFPYSGGTWFYLTVRKKRNNTDLVFSISQGQFSGNSYDNNVVKIRFDDEKPITVSYLTAADGSSDVIFLESVQSLLSKIKKAKKMKIEAQFYQEGLRIAEFDIENFQWPPTEKEK